MGPLWLRIASEASFSSALKHDVDALQSSCGTLEQTTCLGKGQSSRICQKVRPAQTNCAYIKGRAMWGGQGGQKPITSQPQSPIPGRRLRGRSSTMAELRLVRLTGNGGSSTGPHSFKAFCTLPAEASWAKHQERMRRREQNKGTA